MIETLKKLIDLLSPSERKRACLLVVMILVMALLDVVGVASILPFIAVLVDPQLIQTNSILNLAFRASSELGIQTTQQFLFALGILVFLLLVLSLGFKAFTTYAQVRFTLMREYSVAKRLVGGYLHQPYSWFLNRHSADLGKAILSEVSSVINGGLMPLMTLLAQSVVVLALLILLVIVDSLLALTVGIVLGVLYGSTFAVTSGWLKRLGKAALSANQSRFTVLSEAFGAVKEVKLCGLENTYIQRFAGPAEIYAKGRATLQIISQIPRYLIEAIAFSGILLIILYLMARRGSFTSALPVIALYAFAGYRLMPALQQIYQAVTQLRFIGPALNSLHEDLKSLGVDESQQHTTAPILFTQAITLSDVVYRYPNAPKPALKGVTLLIPERSKIGFVGATGSGKTTAIDVVLGLLEPQEGCLAVDGEVITARNRRQWQRITGYVPQQIYLIDDTVTSNIAFGLPAEQVDRVAVERAAKIANLHNFVVGDLPKGYDTTVGERGVRLSGGQRQRIGIARALYHNPQVLIMDEATSALDYLTEQAVMEAVNNLGRGITIILIAHRLSTVRQCDRIFLFEQGEIKAAGTYDELAASSRQFSAMASRV